MDQKIDFPLSRCPACGSRFACGVEAGRQQCWCMDMPVGLAIPQAGARCFCPECLARKRRETPLQPR